MGPLLAALLVAGCGGGGDKNEGKNARNFEGEQKQVAQVIDDLQAASRAGDTTKICTKIFTPSLAKVIGTRSKTTCKAAVQNQLVNPKEDITITQLNVQTPNGLATVREQNGNVTRLTFLKQGGTWRINGIQ
jgi:hypothetical protein